MGRSYTRLLTSAFVGSALAPLLTFVGSAICRTVVFRGIGTC